MSPEYEQVIDPLLTNLLAIVQRADQLTIRDLTVELRDEFDRAHSKLETDREWKAAKYAMVAWVDSEIIISHNRWKDETLEAHYFKTGNAYTEFFLKAEKAYEKRYFNAFEVYYICFMFGYHGVYQTGDKTVVPKALPMTDVEWQKKASSRVSRIRKAYKTESWENTRRPDVHNFGLIGYASFVNNLVIFLVIALVTAAFVFFFWR
jgi:type VI protein secretion system component VasF